MVGCRGISSRNAWRTVPSNGVFCLSFLAGSDGDFIDTTFKHVVMNEGKEGVVISRTSV